MINSLSFKLSRTLVEVYPLHSLKNTNGGDFKRIEPIMDTDRLKFS